jgi:hypothetical protein
MSHELKGREIFRTGIWNEVAFNETDIDDIIANFDNLKHNVPLKFGHDADHKDGQPALGWVERIYKVGNTLLADFTHLPKIVMEAIDAKLYRNISVELLFNVDSDGKKFNHVLDAVALLGADIPAVNSLQDLDALLATRTAFTGGHRQAFKTTAGNVTKVISEVEMDKKEVQDLIDVATKPLADANVQLTKDLDAERAKTAKFTSDAADADKKAKEEKVALARKEVTAVLDAAVTAKSLTPAMRETYEKQIGVADDDRVVEIKLEDVKTMFKVEDKKEDGHTGFHKESDDFDGDAEAELMSLTRKNQAINGKGFDEAFRLTCGANPELHKAYLDSNGEK